MSIGSILNMARQGMNAQQAAVHTASQNIANAQTVGYSRQRVELQAALPTVFPYGSIGTGVNIAGITRARDSMLDAAYRNDSSAASGADTTSSALSQIQSVLNEPSDNGLSSSLDAFWSAWSDLSSDPTNSAAKSVVREAGNNVAATLNRFASQIDSLDQFNRESMNAEVGQVNAYAKQIGDLNVSIIAAESNGQTANDLRDQRDLLLDKVAKIAGGQVVEHTNGAVAVYIGGQMLVDGATVKPLEMHDGQPSYLTFLGNGSRIDGVAGSLGGRLDVSTNHVPMVLSKLDAIAKSLVETVNSIHSGGTVFTGTPPVAGPAGNFFDVTTPAPSGGDVRLTARGIRLSPTLTGPDAIAAAGAGASGPGNNSVALALAGLKDTAVTLTALNGTTTAKLGDFYSDAVGGLATTVKQAQDESTVQSTLASNAETRRQSISGVSTDEELISIIDHQNAYQAAARIVSVVDEMAKTLIELGR